MEGPFTPQVFGHDASVKGYRHDPQKARQLLAEAGYPDGLEITLESSSGRPSRVPRPVLSRRGGWSAWKRRPGADPGA